MNPKLIQSLEKVFWILGWIILATLLFNVGTQIFFACFAKPTFFTKSVEFHFLKQVRLLFSYCGDAYFAFLTSSVFSMISQRDRGASRRTERFLTLTCIGFCGDGALALASWFATAKGVISSYVWHSDLLDSLSAVAYLFTVFSTLMPLVYAATIYVLYRHFTQLVTFESEVI